MKRAWLVMSIVFANAVGSAGVAAQNAPALMPGLWELHAQTTANPGGDAMPSSVCFGAMPAAQREREQANIRSRCSKYDAREIDGQWTVDAVCAARGHSVTKHTVTSLNGDSFREENTAPGGASMTNSGKRLGPCRPGQEPDAYK